MMVPSEICSLVFDPHRLQSRAPVDLCPAGSLLGRSDRSNCFCSRLRLILIRLRGGNKPCNISKTSHGSYLSVLCFLDCLSGPSTGCDAEVRAYDPRDCAGKARVQGTWVSVFRQCRQDAEESPN